MDEAAEHDFYSAFGRLVGDRRRHQGLSQSAVAERLRLTRASISNLEAGRQRPQLYQVVALADILDVDVTKLIPITEHVVDHDRAQIDAILERVGRRRYDSA